MGIYGALSTAVSGLRAQSFALENISGNIANSQTTGFKRVETSFVDLVAEAAVGRQVSGSVLATSKSTNDVQGDVNSSSTSTHVALNRGGYFVVGEKTGTNDGTAIFSGTSYYTRRGDFDVDSEGYLVNGSGYYLKGLPIDPASGNISGSVPEVVQVSNSVLAASQTSRINYELNLPALPKTTEYGTSGNELLQPSDFTDGTGVGGIYQAGDDVSANDSATFLEQSISGGAITVYASNGAAVNVQLRWAKTDSAASGGTDTWELFYMSDSTATGSSTVWTNSDQSYAFDTNGSLNPAVNSVTLTGLSINGIAVGDVTIQHGTNGVTQFADSNGTAQVTTLSQDGYAAGEFISVAVNDSGRIVISYSNGEQVERAQIVIANFNAPNQLKQLDGGTYAATSESGEAIIDLDGGGIVAGALEASNTDISEEFTKLIVTQQAYSASTRIVSTADEMLQEALNMIR